MGVIDLTEVYMHQLKTIPLCNAPKREYFKRNEHVTNERAQKDLLTLGYVRSYVNFYQLWNFIIPNEVELQHNWGINMQDIQRRVFLGWQHREQKEWMLLCCKHTRRLQKSMYENNSQQRNNNHLKQSRQNI